VSTYLLDANVLIALVVADHEHHRRASTWVAGVDRFALAPVVEGALVRYLVRVGEGAATATAVLRAVHAVPSCDVWPDALSYADVDLTHVRGHRQVTDAYLVSLAMSHGARLATFDDGLALAAPGTVDLVP
jgi:toxin-antitoxin system PIN domain toxin